MTTKAAIKEAGLQFYSMDDDAATTKGRACVSDGLDNYYFNCSTDQEAYRIGMVVKQAYLNGRKKGRQEAIEVASTAWTVNGNWAGFKA